MVCKALYDFKASDEEEMDMQRGDTINVQNKADANWWKGTNQRTNKEGLFPKTYVQEQS